uniref:ORF-151 protein n=1 Tax=Lymantria dispar multicapsid nuclear polyhedrosis virus TaxID=10449 RepID=V9THI4_NPVLD|nr:ORF-151 protein [Lymantria dispar multiple nucleopolyhedrovirus]QPD01944.1 hypothetical protein [Lymantria dispar multiple nucleopolyhedrovirus]QPD02118.1 hypothetical protein [Lymantria dispar multiple nucleopolyhedrovirus]
MARIYKARALSLDRHSSPSQSRQRCSSSSRNGGPLQQQIHQDDPRRRHLVHLLSGLCQTSLLFEQYEVRVALEAPAGAQEVGNGLETAAALAVLRVQKGADRLHGLGGLCGVRRVL